MKLHNSLTKKVEEFTPITPGTASIYSCGPTVYDHIHIGNLRAFIMADSLRRTLAAAGFKTKHTMNYTDVDDKTIKRSHQTYPDDAPEEALKTLTREYEGIFMDDMQAIGNDVDAMTFIRATESIEAMQKLITELLDKDFAYIADDGVYFSIQKYKAAGKTYGQLIELNSSNTSEARINNDEYDKESVHDFALWKTKKGDEPAWEFAYKEHDLLGRPGWHIECSAMSAASLGLPFDIHTGGVDLIFPHHENEIAQSTAATDTAYANFFVHNEHLLVEGRKMSKSLNNFFTLRDIREKGFEPVAFRVLVLQAHYRTQLNFSWDNLEAAQNRLRSYYAMAVLQWQTSKSAPKYDLRSVREQLLSHAMNDVDTPKVLAELSGLTKLIEKGGLHESQVAEFKELLVSTDELLGLDLSEQPDVSDEQKELLQRRQEARDKQDWAATDALRNELTTQGITVRDTSQGQVWSRS